MSTSPSEIAVLFDVDNTLLDNGRVIADLLQYELAQLIDPERLNRRSQ